MKTCETCKWFVLWEAVNAKMAAEHPDWPASGHCHRHAPVLGKVGQPKFPGVSADDFCGDHADKDAQ